MMSALLVFLSIAIFSAVHFRGQRSAWTLMTLPTDIASSGYSFLGYTSIFQDQPLMQENWDPVKQMLYFSGVSGIENAMDFYLLRGYAGFLDTLLCPFFDFLTCALMINLLAWAICAGVLWKLTLSIFQDGLAAFLAVLFFCGGTGALFHVNDYSSHFLSFASFYFGVYLLYRFEFIYRAQPWRTHLAMGSYLAVACLTYDTGIMLTVIYGLSAWRKNRWLYLLGVLLIALTSRPLWTHVLHTFLHTSFGDTEADFLAKSLFAWHSLFHQPLLIALRHSVVLLSEFATFDSPLVVLGGAACILLMPLERPVRRLAIWTICVPVLSGYVFSPVATARGYLIYGISIWFYCLLAAQFARGLRSNQINLRARSGALLMLCLITHFIWSTAHLWHWLGPAKVYFLGWVAGGSDFIHWPARLVSITGRETTPFMFGGKDYSLLDAGAFTILKRIPLGPSDITFGTALARRALLTFYLAFAGVCFCKNVRQRWAVGASIIGGTVLLTFLSCHRVRAVPLRMYPSYQISLASRTRLTYRLKLSPTFKAAMKEVAAPQRPLYIHIPADGKCLTYDVEKNHQPLASHKSSRMGESFLELEDPLKLLDPVALEDQFSLQLENRCDHSVWMMGWQRKDLPDRWVTLEKDSKEIPYVARTLPAIEFRIYREDGSVAGGGF
jgi:hypothetical protein